MLKTKNVVVCDFCNAECSEKYVAFQMPVFSHARQGGLGVFGFLVDCCFSCWERRAVAGTPFSFEKSIRVTIPDTLHDAVLSAL